jgi:hypothetical protein
VHLTKKMEDKKKPCSIADSCAAACMLPTRPIGHLGRTVVSARKPRLRPPALAPLLRRRREPQPAAAPATDHKAVSCRRAPLRRAIHDTKVLIQSHHALTISVRQCRSHLVCARSRLRWDCLGMCRIGWNLTWMWCICCPPV